MLVVTMKMLRKSHIFTVIDLETSISLNAKVSILKLLTRLGWFTGFEFFLGNSFQYGPVGDKDPEIENSGKKAFLKSETRTGLSKYATMEKCEKLF